jgi:tetratricopeptide (TPR) repeat protein
VVEHFADAAEPAHRRELIATALGAKAAELGILGQSQAAIAACEDVVQQFGDASEPALREQVARALYTKGLALEQLEQPEAAIAAYEDVVRRFGDAPEPSLREQVAWALFKKGFALNLLAQRPDVTGRQLVTGAQGAIVAWDDVVQRFGDAECPSRGWRAVKC